MEEFYRDAIIQQYTQVEQTDALTSADQHIGLPNVIPAARDLPLNHRLSNRKYAPNVVKTQKYTWASFFIRATLEQFKLFSNQYFLFISLTQLFPALQVGLAFTYYLPLIIVVVISVLKEFIDDLNRWKRDKEINSQPVLTLNGTVKSSDLQPGDLILLKKDDRVPADVVVLQTLDPRGLVYIRTDNLDGEIDWKTRQSVPVLQNAEYKKLSEQRGIVMCGELSKDIYNFMGKYVHLGDNQFNQKQTFPLSMQNTIWQSCVVASSECVAMVVHTGKDTRSQMNTSKPRVKEGRTDVQMNLFVKGLFLFLIIMSLVFTFCSSEKGILTFLRFFVLYNNIIPLSLKVCMDVGKLLISGGIKRDPNMSKIQVNTTSIPEQLGKITHIFSDKTGTLTKNVMRVLKIIYGEAQACEGSHEVIKQLSQKDKEAEPVQTTDAISTSSQKVVQYSELRNQMYKIQQKKQNSLDPLNPQERLEHMMKSIATCHSVSLQDGELLASSPDEVALVKFAAECKLPLTYRDDFTMKINDDEYQIKYTFPFNSVTKRMGIILFDQQTQKYLLYVKGADSVIAKLLIQQYTWLQEKVDQLSCDGLRTLVFGLKELSAEDFDQFDKNYTEASCLLVNRDQKKLELENTLFKDLFLLGITGVEDQLQDGVQRSLEMFRAAGIRTWILSGDKVQTIQCIALSSRLIDSKTTPFRVIENQNDFEKAFDLLQQVRPHECLVIDGASLQTLLGNRANDYYYTHRLVENDPERIVPLSKFKVWLNKIKASSYNYFTGQQRKDLGDDARNTFAKLTSTLPAVCCCRCSPDQKALICKLISQHCQSETAGIGDGANDVSLLQAASVGFGIFGKEGVQAAMASDFALGQFKDIQQLLFWHGRNAYKNTVEACQFVIQRGIIGVLIQAWFSAVYYFTSVVLYSGVLMLGYVCVYSIIPLLCIYVNEDVDYSVTMMYPELYKNLLKGRLLNIKTFFIWNSVAIFGSIVLIFASLHFVQNNFANLVLVSFSALTLVQLELICLTVQRWSWWMVITQILSILVYWISLFVQLDTFNFDYIMSGEYYLETFLVFLMAGGSIWLVYFIYGLIKPTEVVKLKFLQERSECLCGMKTLIHKRSSNGEKYFNMGAIKEQ
ncbi:Phospholipid-transporting_ATPase IA [Hexamita inflata]|uniref:Phospholipid-transporting ATPase n=1 Tax=Hexamita inflata TaxID=28002 RepID=A0AA86R9D3_9EUKA|nr:Phospholipid-transporting ATPase IA [Hexamita inflata]